MEWKRTSKEGNTASTTRISMAWKQQQIEVITKTLEQNAEMSTQISFQFVISFFPFSVEFNSIPSSHSFLSVFFHLVIFFFIFLIALTMTNGQDFYNFLRCSVLFSILLLLHLSPFFSRSTQTNAINATSTFITWTNELKTWNGNVDKMYNKLRI